MRVCVLIHGKYGV